jgi:hypothetical protein
MRPGPSVARRDQGLISEPWRRPDVTHSPPTIVFETTEEAAAADTLRRFMSGRPRNVQQQIFFLCAKFYALARQRKPRKPSISKMIERAEKAGKPVTSVTMPDGTKLSFAEPTPADADNPWLLELDRMRKQ